MRASWRQRVKKMAADMLDVPKDSILDVPRITLIGGLQLYVENYRGVMEFRDDLLRLALSQGELHVYGKSLVVKSIFPAEVVIEGNISGIKYLE
ncbi:sporulation protein YqfC [Tumebacillus sp. DT12]|uniref:Sporulation protein YqfC n=1 Tax=Tumebacillus lacus TaxID=2995335 RepID=A0ABT3X1Q8_9BACL|nr:sporulation protein YqfC [Tumebacillus lacus]MCX7570823.1 sporulation protein YqfC [Tumebacillus lacus]